MFDFYTLQKSILDGQLNTDKIVKVFAELEDYTLTSADFVDLIRASREAMIHIQATGDVLDIVGTGGDTIDTINISTIAMIVAASCGVKVAKHGNRGVTSKVGSSQVLETLGVNIMLNADEATECLDNIGVVFLYAPQFNPAFVHAKEARSQYGKRTYFNLLGPMLNPCQATYSLVGLSDFKYAKHISKSMVDTGSKRVLIVRGNDGVNEVSPCSVTQVFDNQVGLYEIDPSTFISTKVSYDEIQSGDADYNAEIFEQILKGKATSGQIMSVCLNSGTALYTAGKVETIQQGINMSLETIRNGQTWETFEKFRNFTQKFVV